MTNEAEKSAGLVPIRLEAKPMRSLGTTIRNLFYSDDTKNAEYDRLREGEGRPQPLMFLSRQVAYLDLGIADGVGNPDDVADDTAYTEQVAGVTSRMITEEVVPSFQISLPTELKVTRRSIELGVTLQFRNDEDKEAIVAPPLFPEGFNERVTMFTRISRRKLVGEQSVWRAYSTFTNLVKASNDAQINTLLRPIQPLALVGLKVHHPRLSIVPSVDETP